MRRGHLGVLAVLGLVVQLGCPGEQFVNPYDPERTSSTAIKKGVITGRVHLEVGADFGGVTVRIDPVDGSLAGDEITTRGLEPDPDENGLFASHELLPGSYNLTVTVVGFEPQSMNGVQLYPDQRLNVGTFRMAVARGSARGRVVVEDAPASGGVRVVLVRQDDGAGQSSYSTVTDAQGAYEINGVPEGNYTAVADRADYTPDESSAFAVHAEVQVEVEQMRLTPVTSVLHMQDENGELTRYTNRREVQLEVLAFGARGGDALRMRLSESPSPTAFHCNDEASDWVDHDANPDHTLGGDAPDPLAEGTRTIYAHFCWKQSGEVVSTLFSLDVIYDRTPPEVRQLELAPASVEIEGRRFLVGDPDAVPINLLGFDQHALINGIHLFLGDTPDGTPSFDLIEATGQLVSKNYTRSLPPGEGLQQVGVMLKDNAGNVTDAFRVGVVVDTIAPVIDAFLIDNGAAFTSRRTVILTIEATDQNHLSRMKIWNEGRPEPAGWDVYQPLRSFDLEPLDYGRTSRQVNLLLADQSGNLSTQSSATIVYDDRGRLVGRLLIENDADGQPGDPAGVLATVNGTSYPFTPSAGENPGDPYTFVVTEVPAGNNRQLVLTKDGYADATPGAPYTVEAGVATDVGLLQLRRARGAIDGYVLLQGQEDHSEILATLVGTTQIALTDSTGYFRIDDVPAGPGYTLLLRKGDDYTTKEVTGVDVPALGATSISTAGAPLFLSPRAGNVRIEPEPYHNDTEVMLVLTYAGATQYRASESSDFEGDTVPWRDFVQPTTRVGFTLDDRDGLHTVHVQFRDPSPTGFLSEVYNATVIVDRVAPTNVQVVINSGTGYARSFEAVMTLGGYDEYGLARYDVAVKDQGDDSAPEEEDFDKDSPFPSGPVGVVLSVQEVYQTVHLWVRLVDVAGNRSDPVHVQVVMDPAAPASLGIAIEDNAPVTSSFTVTLTLQATDDSPIEMLLGNAAVPVVGTWEPFAADRVWTLPPADEGTKRVCVKYRDIAGNETQELCDEIEYDPTPPPVPEITTTLGLYTSIRTVSVQFGNVTADVQTIELASNAAFSNATVSTAQSSVDFVLPEPDGVKVIYARYQDAAGNRSLAAVLDIVLDREAPAPATIAIAGGDVTRDPAIEVALSAPGATQMMLVQGEDCTAVPGEVDGGSSDAGEGGGDWVAFQPLVSFDLVGADGLKAISAMFRDLAGNETACLTDRVTLDRSAPELGTPAIAISNLQIVLNAGGDAVEAAYVRLDLDVSDAAEMRISNLEGGPGASWQPYASTVTGWRLTAGDGGKNVYAMFRDTAGNPTVEVSDSAQVVSTGSVRGTLILEDTEDYSDLAIQLGTRVLPHSMDGNEFTVADVLVDFYAPVKVSKPGYLAGYHAGVQVVPGAVTEIPTINLYLPKGHIEGFVELENASSHDGVTIELRDTGYVTTSNSNGYFRLEDVLAGTYDLRAMKDDFLTRIVEGVAVLTGTTTELGTIQLSEATGDFRIDGDAIATSQREVILELIFPENGQYMASESEDFAGADWNVYTTDVTEYGFTLGDVDGDHTIYVNYKDGVGVELQAPLQGSIVLDRVPPVIQAVALAGGAEATNDLSIVVTVSASDTGGSGLWRMQRSEDGGTTFLPAVSYQNPFVWLPTDTDQGEKCLHVRVIDLAGNASDDGGGTPAGDCVEYDTVVPQNPSIAIEDAEGHLVTGELITTSEVLVRAYAEGASEMRLSRQSSMADASWQPYDTDPHPITLIAGDGTRQVYANFRDPAGNSLAVPVNSSVTVDSTAPAAPIFTIDEGTHHNSLEIHLSFDNQPGAGHDVVVVSNQDLAREIRKDAADRVSITLPDADGLHLLTVYFEDAAGNRSEVSTGSVTIDRGDPAVLAFSVSGNGYTSGATVTLLLEAEGAYQMRFSNTSDLSGASWETLRSSRSGWPLDTAGQGTKTIWAQVRDLAGNLSTATTTTVVYDTQLNLATLTLAEGAAVTGAQAVIAEVTGYDADVAYMAVSNGAIDCDNASYVTFAERFNHVLGSTNQLYTVTVCLQDLAGNVQDISDEIRYDSVTPAFTVDVDDSTTDGQGSVNVVVTLATAEAATTTVYLTSPNATMVDFEIAAGVTTGDGTIALLPSAGGYADGDVILQIEAVDAAGNRYSTTRLVEVDRQAPSATLVIDGGATYTTAASGQATLAMSASDSVSGLYRMRFSNDGSNWDSWITYTASYGPWTLATPSNQDDVERTVYAQFSDNAGNISGSVTDTIRLDNVVPSNAGVDLPGSHTSKTSVTLTLQATGASEMKISNGQACAGGSWEDFATSKDWVLDGEGDGVQKYVSARYRDAAGNISGCVSDSIIVDTSNPQLPSVVIDGGELYNNSSTHTLVLTLSAVNATEMRVSGSFDFSGATWEDYAGSKTFTLADTSDGEKTVYAQFRDDAGNTTAVVSDGVIHDTTAPAGGFVSINNGTSHSNDVAGQVDLYLSASDALSGVDKVYVSNDGSTWTERDYASVLIDWTLDDPLAANGEEKTVYAEYADRAGNRSSAVNDTIRLDNVGPTALAMQINGGAANANSVAAHLTLTSDSDVIELAVSNSAMSCASAAYGPFVPEMAWTLSAGDGDKEVQACVRDGAGNTLLLEGTTIILDTAEPVIALFEIDGGAEFATGTSVHLAYYSPDSDVAAVAVSNEGTFSDSTPVAWDNTVNPNTASWTLDPGDGPKNVYVRFTDSADNSTIRWDQIVLDTEAPGGVDLRLVNGMHQEVDYINGATIMAVVDAVGVWEVCLDGDILVDGSPVPDGTCDDATDGHWVLYDNVVDLILTDGNGLKTVTAHYRDQAGNLGEERSDTVTRDDDDPVAGTLTLTGLAATTDLAANYTRDRNVTVRFNGASDVGSGHVYMNVWEGEPPAECGAPEENDWKPYQQTSFLTFSADDGVKLACAQVRDRALNRSATISARITLDTEPPEVPLRLIGKVGGNRDSEEYTRRRLVTVDLSGAEDFYDEGSGSYQYKISRTGDFGGGVVWSDYPHAVSGTVSNYDIVDGATPTCRTLVVLNEIDIDGTTRVELYNGTAMNVDLKYWTMECYVDGVLDVTWELPEATIAAQDYLILDEGSGTDRDDYIYLNSACGWDEARPGAAVLRNERGQAVDFVRFNHSTTAPPLLHWITESDPVLCTVAAPCGRNNVHYDRNIAADWCPESSGLTMDDATDRSNETDCGLTEDDCTKPSGLREVFALVRDRAGNVGAGNARIELDVRPAYGSFSINDGAAYLTEPHVEISVNGADDETAVELMTFTVDKFTDPVSWFPYAQHFGFGLSGAVSPGTKHIYMALRDVAGNETPLLFNKQTIVYDDADPVCTLDITGTTYNVVSDTAEANSTLTALSEVTLTVTEVGSDTSGIASVQVANDPGFGGGIRYDFDASPLVVDSWQLAGGDANGEPRQVFIRCKDGAGREGVPVQDNINLDTVKPFSPWIEVENGSEFTTETTVHLRLAAEMADYAMYSLDPSFTGESWVAGPAPWDVTNFNISGANEGWVVVYGKFKDIAGNQTDVISDQIFADWTPPSAPTELEVRGEENGGTYYVNEPTAQLSWTASVDGDIAAYEVRLRMPGNNTMTFFTGGTTFISPVLIDNPPGLSIAWQVCAHDEAGNMGDCADGSPFVIDTEDPSAPQFAPPLDTVVDLDNIDLRVAVPAADTNLLRYEIRSTADHAWQQVIVPPMDINYPLAPDRANVLHVRAVDKALNISDEDFVLLREDSTPPSPIDTLVVDNRDGEVELQWTPPTMPSDFDIAGYKVYYGFIRSGDPAAYNGNFADQGRSPVDVGMNTSLTLTGLVNGSSFFVVVAAYDQTTDPGPHESDFGPEHAVEALPNNFPIKALTQFELNGARDIKTKDGYVYVTNVETGLHVYRAVDLLNGVQIPVRTFGSNNGKYSKIAIHGTRAFLYGPEKPGLRVVNLADPEDTSQGLGPLRQGTRCFQVLVPGHLIEGAGSDNGVYSYGVFRNAPSGCDNSNPMYLGRYDDLTADTPRVSEQVKDDAFPPVVEGDYDEISDAKIVRNMLHLSVGRVYDGQDYPRAPAVAAEYHLLTYDIEDPDHLRLLDAKDELKVNLYQSVFGFDVSDYYVYAGVQFEGIARWDFNAPSPDFSEMLEIRGYPGRLKWLGNYLFVAMRKGENLFSVFDISDRDQPALVGGMQDRWALSQRDIAFDIYGNHLFAVVNEAPNDSASDNAYLVVGELGRPRTMETVASQVGYDFHIKGMRRNYLFGFVGEAQTEGLIAVNYQDPANTSVHNYLLGMAGGVNDGRMVGFNDDRYWAAALQIGDPPGTELHLFDFSILIDGDAYFPTGTQPTRISSTAVGLGDFVDITVQGNYVVLSTQENLLVSIDISDPDIPAVKDVVVAAPGQTGIEFGVVGNRVYTASGTTLHEYQVDSSGAFSVPVEVGVERMDRITSVKSRGNEVFLVGQGERSFQVWSRSSLSLLGYDAVPSPVRYMRVYGDLVVLSVSGEGEPALYRIYIYDVSDPSDPTLIYSLSTAATRRAEINGPFMFTHQPSLDLFRMK